MNCKQVRSLINGYIDGELDLLNALEIEDHLISCTNCSQEYRSQMALRSAIKDANLYTPAPAGFQKRVRSAVRQVNKVPRTWHFSQWRWITLTALLVFVVFTTVVIERGWFLSGTADRLAFEVQSAHVRSLMANHLTDIASTDQHTVKPWFDGKLDFSPPVVDLATQGYPLIGGRLDYLDNHAVAALVYMRKKHTINVFIWPTAVGQSNPRSSTNNGYNLFQWNQLGMTYWVVSDLNRAELQAFVELLQQNLSS
jgi:anti-sigma factor RsiW